MKFCPFCGAQLLTESQKFCTECGTPLPASILPPMGKGPGDEPDEHTPTPRSEETEKAAPVLGEPPANTNVEPPADTASPLPSQDQQDSSIPDPPEGSPGSEPESELEQDSPATATEQPVEQPSPAPAEAPQLIEEQKKEDSIPVSDSGPAQEKNQKLKQKTKKKPKAPKAEKPKDERKRKFFNPHTQSSKSEQPEPPVSPFDVDYDGYYNDVLPIDSDRKAERVIDKELIKKLLILIGAAAALIVFCSLLMILL